MDSPRVLPHDLDAERSVLGAILINNSVYPGAAAIIQPSDFFRVAHRHVWECICGLLARDVAADLVTVKESLERNGLLEEVGGPAYVASFVDGVPRSLNVTYYAGIVKEKAQKRRVIFDANKRLGQAYGEEMLASDLARAAIADLSVIEAGGDRVGPRPVVVTLETVRPESIRWLWQGRLAFGKLTVLSGDPGLGKSFITMDLAARASTGRPWPDGARAIEPIHVLILAAEDGLADTVRPRLDALGADVSRVHVMTGTREHGKERGPLLVDVAAIEAAILEKGARLLVIDPVSAYLGDADSHRDSEVRGLLTPLMTMAERHDCAVIGVMHLTKDGSKAALYRTSGSVAFVAQARAALMVTPDSGNPDRRILAPSKCNVAKMPDALAYTMIEGRLEWEDTPLTDFDLNVHLAAASASAGRDRGEQTDAEEVITELLSDVDIWPLDAKALIEAGGAHGIHERTMRRTAKNMGLKPSKLGYQGKWIYSRPKSEIKGDTKADSSLNTDTVSPLSPLVNQAGNSGHTHKGDSSTAFPRARETVIPFDPSKAFGPATAGGGTR